MDNLSIYNIVREVPKEAKREITAGRLKGKTDINPMWRIKKLTEVYGQCGIGWKYKITDKRMEESTTGEIACFIDIDLFVNTGEKWSEAIPGTGGSMFVAKEKNGLYTSDECFKMALTDAISVSCKALGFGADVYWDKDTTKYSDKHGQHSEPKAPKKQTEPETNPQILKLKKAIARYSELTGLSIDEVKFAVKSDTKIDLDHMESDHDCDTVIVYLTNMAKSFKAQTEKQ